MIIKIALRGYGVRICKDINQKNRNIHKFDLRQTLPRYLRAILNKFEALMILANGPIILGVSWRGAGTKGEVHKHKLKKNMFL